MIAAAAILTLVMPDPQKRSSVTPLARMSYPASRADIRPRSPLCWPTLGAGAPDDVVDIGRIDPGAIGQRPQHRRAELLRMNVGQRALAGLANASRRSACVDDQRVHHGVSFGLLLAAFEDDRILESIRPADKLFRVFVVAAIDGLRRVHRQQIIQTIPVQVADIRCASTLREPENNVVDLAATIVPATDIFRAPGCQDATSRSRPLHRQTGSLYYNPDGRSNNYQA